MKSADSERRSGIPEDALLERINRGLEHTRLRLMKSSNVRSRRVHGSYYCAYLDEPARVLERHVDIWSFARDLGVLDAPEARSRDSGPARALQGGSA